MTAVRPSPWQVLPWYRSAPNCPCPSLTRRKCGGATGGSSMAPLAFSHPTPSHVAVLGKHLGLEPAHGVGRWRPVCQVCRGSASSGPGQPFSVVRSMVEPARRLVQGRVCLRRPAPIGLQLRPPQHLQTLIRRSVPADHANSPEAARQVRPEVMGALKLQPYTPNTSVARGTSAFSALASSECSRYQDLPAVGSDQRLALMITDSARPYPARRRGQVAGRRHAGRVDMGEVPAGAGPGHSRWSTRSPRPMRTTVGLFMWRHSSMLKQAGSEAIAREIPGDPAVGWLSPRPSFGEIRGLRGRAIDAPSIEA